MSYYSKSRPLSERPLSGISDIFGSIWSGIKTGGQGALTFYGNTKAQEGQIAALTAQQAAAAPGGTSDLILPLAVVGLGVGAFFLLRKKKA